MLRFALVHVVLFFYLLMRLVVPLPAPVAVRAVLGLVLLVVSQHYLVRMFFDAMAAPEAPAWFLALEGWSFATLLFLSVLVLGRDLWLLGRRLLPGARRTPTFSPGRRAVIFSVAAAIPAFVGVRNGIALPEIRRTGTRLPRLPRELDGLTVVQLTDVHVSALFRKRWVEEVVRRVNALAPDLILFTGDTVDGQLAVRAEDVAPLAGLRARYGIYGCTENHEYYSGYHSWMDAFSRLGITMLENAHTVVRVRNRNLVLAGVTDKAAEGFGLPGPDVAAALHGAPREACCILLEHRPGNARHNALAGVDLQLSGHTHGGHIRGMDQIVGLFNEHYVYGWYEEKDMRLYVSSGAGLWNGFPVRLGVPSEIACITLRSGTA